ncbi:MAG: hypothetical protein IKG93_01145 [Clostridiales bacterium]|nr:hypothetical protein [Clostridiales bacterium]
MRRAGALLLCVLTLFVTMNCYTRDVKAIYSYIHFSSGGSGYSSDADTIYNSNHSTYYVKLDRFKFGSYSQNEMPSGGLIYARAYKVVGSQLEAAGDGAAFSTTGNGYNYYYWNGYGHVNDSYKLKSNSNVSDSCTACFVWHA